MEKEIIDLQNKQLGDNKIIGKSKVMGKMFSTIEKLSNTDAAVLICGETGTGKESIAHLIHNSGLRKEKPLGIIDCASIPSELLESELFGHEKGSFTGAITQRKGLFEISDRGSVFLDEISELPLHLQSKLLRVLQEKDIKRIGGNERKKVDVRIIAASNKSLEELVEAGQFREDLFYRLNVVPISLPPLRDRESDIILLANYFLSKFGRNRKKAGFTKTAEEAIKNHKWPGNVREMQHRIERAIILGDSEYLSPEDLELANKNTLKNYRSSADTNNINEKSILLTKNDIFNSKEKEGILYSLKRKVIKLVLEQTNGDISESSKILGVNRATIYRNFKTIKSKQ